ncbi:MAG: 30S ribosomal protein S9 [Abitibacteriaceae bacterium]|nr:30S ribosomal protein S9 [Abditibacteriaceae bacterium]MBV9865943.1 30S ribosomal protein S9 [Abditibacteriaceae bacterium]
MPDTFYGTGKRKDAVARVWIMPGSGQITINEKTIEEYFPRIALQQLARQPLGKLPEGTTFDIKATAAGGGLTGQAGALRHGIAKALVQYSEELRPEMRAIDAMTRDPRVKERKKYGHKRARRGFQFSKR